MTDFATLRCTDTACFASGRIAGEGAARWLLGAARA